MNGENNDNNLSLNQIDLIFREIAQNHAMINSYGEGLESEINTQTIANYPLMWCTILPTTLGYRTLQYSYRIFVLDLVNQDETRRLLEVQSDTLRTLTDIVMLLRDYYDLVIDFDIQASPVVDSKPDLLTGFYMELKITVGYSLGMCDVPEKSPSYLVDYDDADIQDSDQSLIDENQKLYK